jgi:benzoyl-CoA reductase/2-hydroxyglutaryl-CoA dehydratase subunit BcrC/BadD/HgdB
MMPAMSDLVERLRVAAQYSTDDDAAEMLREAADEIEQLRAENERLRAALAQSRA